MPLTDCQVHAPDGFGAFLQPSDKVSPVGGIGEKVIGDRGNLAGLSTE